MESVDIIYRIGVDVGSTTLKMIVLDSAGQIVYKSYKRHQANIHPIFAGELQRIHDLFPHAQFQMKITGSAGMGIAERTDISFVQEVVASVETIRRMYPETQTMIDLGGEDSKMVFFTDGKHPDIRMNGSCAGGTGAFIDQMADLMNISLESLGEQALQYEKIYPVASRCGVFAKTDVQNLISRNMPIPDIAKSILHTVALQSITSLARGQSVRPQILCIGGPLTFIPALLDSFKTILEVEDADFVLPENSEYFPAWGSALCCNNEDRVTDDFFTSVVAPQPMTAAQPTTSVTSATALIPSIPSSTAATAKATIISVPTIVTPAASTTAEGTPSSSALQPLFQDKAEYDRWKVERKIKYLKRRTLQANEQVDCFLGIDSGSTTTKILITDENDRLIYTYYAPNKGNPLKKAVEGLQAFYDEAAANGFTFRFVASAATGYGEELIKSALGLDVGIVETMAHLTGAQYVDPNVSFVLDIGGQDMKSIFTHQGVISNIELNEACSSGCGSFLQNFAATMNLTLTEFTQSACLAKYPSDLGSRCTVFMNSKVKQSLRENAALGDIAAGLAYSVVKNCLFKVLKIANLNKLGDHIVVQGGTFRNDAVYRALELLSGKDVSSTDYPELMGAFGAALYAKKWWWQTQRQAQESSSPTRFTGAEPLPDTDRIDTRELQCKGCTNRCSVFRFKFENGNTCYAGNKCEKMFYNKNTAPEKGFNAFDLKNKLLFDQGDELSLPNTTKPTIRQERASEVVSGDTPTLRIGIPRVLNMFENYPFWHTLFTACGFETVLSPESTFPLYQKGVGSVMSDNICFPAKLVHGHMLALVEQQVDRIFYPIIPKEEKEYDSSCNSYNCPVVSGYPDVIRSAMDPEENYGIPFDKPVITFDNQDVLKRKCDQYVSSLGTSADVFEKAFQKAWTEYKTYRKRLYDKQKQLLDEAVRTNRLVFVVAGRPYHADPLIHQKVGQILSDLGITVLTDDVFSIRQSEGFSRLNIVSQWSYPNRVIQAAMEVAKLPQNVQLIQLNSFGCGPDSFFMDETTHILKQAGKNHTILRIDEIASPGSIRLRLRSLIESLKVTSGSVVAHPFEGYPAKYTKSDRRKTILVPWFADFISPLIPAIGQLLGYKIENLPKSNKTTADAGLKYGHNEVCYPSTLVLGDIITTLQSGKYDPEEVVVAITQTGGQCRATNYLSQIKSGLENAGFSQIPVVVLSTGKVHQNDQEAFKLPLLKYINIIIYAVLYGDALQQMFSSTVVREKKKGETKQLFDFYMERAAEAVGKNNYKLLLQLLEQAVADFNQLPVYDRTFEKVGLVGEIYVKYNNYGQAYTTDWLREKGVEVVTPPIIDFFMQYFVNSKVNEENGLKHDNWLKKALSPLMWNYMNKRMSRVASITEKYRFYAPTESVYVKAEYAAEVLDLSNQFGEGWMIAAEIACYSRSGINKVVCVQPFGCIANHIVAKGIEKRVKKLYPQVSLLYLDIDGGMAEVNLQNRLHFLIE